MYFCIQPVALAENTEGNMGKSVCDFNISNTEYIAYSLGDVVEFLMWPFFWCQKHKNILVSNWPEQK